MSSEERTAHVILGCGVCAHGETFPPEYSARNRPAGHKFCPAEDCTWAWITSFDQDRCTQCDVPLVSTAGEPMRKDTGGPNGAREPEAGEDDG